ncbi:Calcineurin-like metallo-phosphoesterase superfamily protein [Zea mays]|uniref:Calcineurin-like metallo-phosphoesterase superfamily protein n=1 Tax=Zea mays TaxID=4577 RepID=A0A1D6I489_MAIZE|nr:Calcineurin-like metallo-phosphoesterase superfamily protein [Zea mays]
MSQRRGIPTALTAIPEWLGHDYLPWVPKELLISGPRPEDDQKGVYPTAAHSHNGGARGIGEERRGKTRLLNGEQGVAALPADALATALVIFLGDYNDCGPHTRRVLNFLLALPTRYLAQHHVFLCGNHDLPFTAFIGALPPPPDGSPFSATWDEYIHNEEHKGWFRGPGFEGMHV